MNQPSSYGRPSSYSSSRPSSYSSRPPYSSSRMSQSSYGRPSSYSSSRMNQPSTYGARTILCPNCGRAVRDDLSVCPFCQHRLK
jgi:hypothetical protein